MWRNCLLKNHDIGVVQIVCATDELSAINIIRTRGRIIGQTLSTIGTSIFTGHTSAPNIYTNNRGRWCVISESQPIKNIYEIRS